MKKIAYIFAALLFCVSSLWAEVYTIDFNKGTVSGGNIKTSLGTSVAINEYCTLGTNLFTLTNVSDCFYDSSGCGIRIGKESGTGQALFLITLCEEIQNKYIVKIVVYASRGTNNATAEFNVYAGTNDVTKTIYFADMLDYSSSNPESSNYVLSGIALGKSFKKLKLEARNSNCVILHRIDIYTDKESQSFTLPAQSGSTYYSTFSSSKVTYFPNTAMVSKVSVSDGRLSVTALESKNDYGTSGYFVPANTGVLVASENNSTTYYILNGRTPDTLTGNMLRPASEPMTGDNKFYKLAYDDYDNKTGLGFYWGAAGGAAFPCKEGAAYLAVPNNGSSVKGFVLDEASDEDAIKSLTPDFSQGRGEIFYMTGQRISKPLQGIYIKGGRKYVGK